MPNHFKYVINQSLSYLDAAKGLTTALSIGSEGGWNDEVGSSYGAYASMVAKMGDVVQENVSALSKVEENISEKPLERRKGNREMLEKELRSLK